jgi:hypothetical protein
MLLGGFARGESSQVPPPAGLRIELAGIEPIFARFKFSDHGILVPSSSGLCASSPPCAPPPSVPPPSDVARWHEPAAIWTDEKRPDAPHSATPFSLRAIFWATDARRHFWPFWNRVQPAVELSPKFFRVWVSAVLHPPVGLSTNRWRWLVWPSGHHACLRECGEILRAQIPRLAWKAISLRAHPAGPCGGWMIRAWICHCKNHASNFPHGQASAGGTMQLPPALAVQNVIGSSYYGREKLGQAGDWRFGTASAGLARAFSKACTKTGLTRCVTKPAARLL